MMPHLARPFNVPGLQCKLAVMREFLFCKTSTDFNLGYSMETSFDSGFFLVDP
jgi:hypothetical protein